MKVNLIKPMQVWITPLAMHKMTVYTALSSDEVGWLGIVEELDNGDFRITDTYLTKQQVHGCTCELLPEGISELAIGFLREPEGDKLFNSLRLWGHSHVNMGVSPSSQDDKQLETLSEHSDWFIRLIMNKRGDVSVTLYDKIRGLIIEELPWSVDYGLNMVDEIRKELEEKVSKIVPQYTKWNKPEVTVFGDVKQTQPKKEDKKLKTLQERITENRKVSEQDKFVKYLEGSEDDETVETYGGWLGSKVIYLDSEEDVYDNVNISTLFQFGAMIGTMSEDALVQEIIDTLSRYDEFEGIDEVEANVVLEVARDLSMEVYGNGIQ